MDKTVHQRPGGERGGFDAFALRRARLDAAAQHGERLVGGFP